MPRATERRPWPYLVRFLHRGTHEIQALRVPAVADAHEAVQAARALAYYKDETTWQLWDATPVRPWTP